MFILDLIQKFYYNVEYVWPDPRTNHYPLVYTPFPWTIFGIFLLFVYYLGPKYMQGRQPYRLKKIVIIYNVLQMIFNGYLVVSVVRLCYWPLRYSLWCQPVETGTSPREVEITVLVWLYYVCKIIDIMDTVFIIMRKKYSQLTLLHIFHHAGMILFAWGGIKYVPGGQSLSIGLTNCFVHVVMYGYYLLTLVDKRCTSSWWKKHITQIQMLQFFIMGFHHSISAVIDCGYPRIASSWIVFCTFSITYLFALFYWNAYVQPERREKES